jgi:hypothetical protein
MLGGAKTIAVVDDESGERVGRVPVVTGAALAAMSEKEREAYGDRVAAAAGVSKEDWAAVKDEALVRRCAVLGASWSSALVSNGVVGSGCCVGGSLGWR